MPSVGEEPFIATVCSRQADVTLACGLLTVHKTLQKWAVAAVTVTEVLLCLSAKWMEEICTQILCSFTGTPRRCGPQRQGRWEGK